MLDLADFYEFWVYISADEHLFKKILSFQDHILQVLLLPPAARITILERDNKAVMAMPSGVAASIGKTRQKRAFWSRKTSQNASFPLHLALIDLGSRLDPAELARSPDPQGLYDSFYSLALGLLEEFYPERTITVTSRDSKYMTAGIKTKLRRKNRLMRAGRLDEAGALAQQIARHITRRSKRQLERIGSNSNTKELWKVVRQLTGREHEPAVDPCITADSLNRH